jgi:hypothetical protein
MESFRSSHAGRVVILLGLLLSAGSLVSTTTADAQGRRGHGQHHSRRGHHRPPPPPAVRISDPFVDQGRFSAASLRLDGQAHEVTVVPGATIQAEMDINQSCPGCGGAINQIIVGFAGAPQAEACVWSGGAHSRGWQRTRFTLRAPTRPGDYEIRVRYAQANGCAQGALGWWRVDRPNGPGPEATIGLVHVVPQGPPPPPPSQPPPPHYGRSLIENGSFEVPAVGRGNWRLFPAIQGWQLASGPGIEVQSHTGSTPADGNQLVELDSTGSSAMYQDVRTRPGAVYELRIAISPRPGRSGADNRLAVRFGGQQIAIVEGGREGRDARWSYVTYRVVASSHISRLELADVGPSNGFGILIDDVSLIQISR